MAKIMLVEDNPLMREALARSLQAAGHTVQSAARLSEGL